jgi:hypothetical protein
LTDNMLPDLGMTQDDYNNGTTVQLLCFLAAEFPVQLLIKRYGFKQVLPLLMMMVIGVLGAGFHDGQGWILHHACADRSV